MIHVRYASVPFRFGENSLALVKVPLAAQYKVLHAEVRHPNGQGSRLYLRVRELGPVHGDKRFLVLMDPHAPLELPRVVLQPHDPPDSDALQWSFWQGARVGGDIYHDVFDVTHLTLEGFGE